MDNKTNEEWIRLESLIALQDQTIKALSEELYSQQKEVQFVKRTLQQLENRLTELEEPQSIAPNERPPHW